MPFAPLAADGPAPTVSDRRPAWRVRAAVWIGGAALLLVLLATAAAAETAVPDMTIPVEVTVPPAPSPTVPDPSGALAPAVDAVDEAAGGIVESADPVEGSGSTVADRIVEATDPVEEPVSAVAGRVGRAAEPVSGVAGDALSPVAEDAARRAEPVLRPVADGARPVVEVVEPSLRPAADSAGRILDPLAPVVSPVTSSVSPVTSSVSPVTSSVSSVTSIAPVTTVAPGTTDVVPASTPPPAPAAPPTEPPDPPVGPSADLPLTLEVLAPIDRASTSATSTAATLGPDASAARARSSLLAAGSRPVSTSTRTGDTRSRAPPGDVAPASLPAPDRGARSEIAVVSLPGSNADAAGHLLDLDAAALLDRADRVPTTPA